MQGMLPWIGDGVWYDCFIEYGCGGYEWHYRLLRHYGLEQRAMAAAFGSENFLDDIADALLAKGESEARFVRDQLNIGEDCLASLAKIRYARDIPAMFGGLFSGAAHDAPAGIRIGIDSWRKLTGR